MRIPKWMGSIPILLRWEENRSKNHNRCQRLHEGSYKNEKEVYDHEDDEPVR
jgi:hypothetical protein